jgi:predicted HicB family RNase H-like nuclease
MKSISLRIDDEMHQELRKQSFQKKLSINKIITNYIQYCFDKKSD